MLNKLMRLPEKIPCDKRIHFMVGSVFTAFMMLVTINYLILIGAVVVLAWGVEIYQKLTKSGTYDNYDAIAVVLGGLTVMIPLLRSLYAS